MYNYDSVGNRKLVHFEDGLLGYDRYNYANGQNRLTQIQDRLNVLHTAMTETVR